MTRRTFPSTPRVSTPAPCSPSASGPRRTTTGEARTTRTTSSSPTATASRAPALRKRVQSDSGGPEESEGRCLVRDSGSIARCSRGFCGFFRVLHALFLLLWHAVGFVELERAIGWGSEGEIWMWHWVADDRSATRLSCEPRQHALSSPNVLRYHYSVVCRPVPEHNESDRGTVGRRAPGDSPEAVTARGPRVVWRLNSTPCALAPSTKRLDA